MYSRVSSPTEGEIADRVLRWANRASTALLAVGLALLMARPLAAAGATAVYAGVAALMLTPMARVVLAAARALGAGDSTTAGLAAAILAAVAASIIVAFGPTW